MKNQYLIGMIFALLAGSAMAAEYPDQRVFVFDPKAHTWTAYLNGHVINSGRASGGKNYCADVKRACRTVVGSFKVFSKGNHACKSSRFPVPHGGAPMPYCMKFHKSGYAVHASNDVPNANASHGCVRVTLPDAKWLSQNFMKIGTTVIVKPYH